jgi:hypothetical protein
MTGGPLPSPRPAPPTWRDPWAWLTAAAVLPLLAGLSGAPLGEAVAEDFDFLVRALLAPANSLLDGGGSGAFWRPVSHQLYYEALGPLILARPGVVAGIHAALLALAAVLLYRLLRRQWPGGTAAAAATFPLLGESTRTLIAWPSHFIDVGLFLFSMLALHEAAHRRRATALAALLLALLCKELAVVTALLLPFLPGLGGRRERIGWAAWAWGLAAAWAAAYLLVRQSAGLELPHGIERDAAVAATPLGERLRWAEWNTLRAAFSLSLVPGPGDRFGLALAVVLVAGAGAAFAFGRDARARLRARQPWIAWGGAWFVLAAAALASVHPLWSPNRSQFASSGLGVGLVAAAAAAHPALPAVLVASRLALLSLAPPPAASIPPEAETRGAFIDVPRLTRLQRLMRETRLALAARHPALPPNAVIGWRNLPLSAEYAFGGANAIRVWYRDPTLRWIDDAAFQADPDRPLATIVDYQPRHAPQIVLLEPAAVRWQAIARRRLEDGQWSAAIEALDRADSLQADRRAAVFLGDNAGRRAYCLASLGRLGEALPEARRAVAAAGEDVGARYVLALAEFAARRHDAAQAQLDTLLRTDPAHAEGLELRAVMASRR